ncbi:MAG TPA: glycosyl hydrolase family 28 protein, partial [Cytophagaceae bacterium]
MIYPKSPLIILFIACLHLSLAQAASKPEIYPFTEGAKTAQDFTVSIGGTKVQVYDSPVAALAQFGIEGQTSIEIWSEIDIKRVDIRPKSLNIQYKLVGKVITVILPFPCKISVELNANIMRPLFIFANPKTTDAPSANDSKVKFYKAGKIYDVGRVALKSNETVYIEAGAVVRGSFKSNNSENITLRGNGILEGKVRPGRDTNGNFVEDWGRTVNFKKCKNVKIMDIIILDSQTWDVVPDLCTNVIIKNIKIASGNAGDDGMDIVSCQDVLIEDCFI